jgi:hypothetical protein
MLNYHENEIILVRHTEHMRMKFPPLRATLTPCELYKQLTSRGVSVLRHTPITLSYLIIWIRSQILLR